MGLVRIFRQRWRVTVAVVAAVILAGSLYAVFAAGYFDSPAGRATGAEAQPASPGAQDLSAPPASGSAAPSKASPSPSRREVSGRGPIPNGWPTPDSTGWKHTGVTLKPYGGSGEIVITKSGTVIDGADIRARVRILANNVTIKRSRVTATSCDSSDGCYVLHIEKGFQGLTVEDVEVTRSAEAQNIDRAIVLAESGGSKTSPRAVIRRAYVHGTYRGIYLGDNVVVENSYVDDIDRNPPAEAHTAAISAHGGRNITIRHNTVGLPPTPANSANISLYGDFAPLEDLLIEDNLFNGGTSCLWLTTNFTRAGGSFVTIRNNLFGVKYHSGCGMHEPAYIVPRDAGGSNFTWSGNVWYAPGDAKNGKPVDLSTR